VVLPGLLRGGRGRRRPLPRCAADLTGPPRDFEESLIRALRHPLPDRRLLAAEILGARRAHAALPRLIQLVEEGDDPYLMAEAVTALARIGDPAALAVVRQIAQDSPVVARPGTSSLLPCKPCVTSDGARCDRLSTEADSSCQAQERSWAREEAPWTP